MENNISNKIAHIVTELYGLKEDVELTRPDPKFGDWASNIALKLSKNLGENPRQVAEQIATKLKDADEVSGV